jgi:hypothetical protein
MRNQDRYHEIYLNKPCGIKHVSARPYKSVSQNRDWNEEIVKRTDKMEQRRDYTHIHNMIVLPTPHKRVRITDSYGAEDGKPTILPGFNERPVHYKSNLRNPYIIDKWQYREATANFVPIERVQSINDRIAAYQCRAPNANIRN